MIMNLTDAAEQRDVVNVVMALKPETIMYCALGGNVELVRSEYKGLYDGSPESFRAISRIAIDLVKRGSLSPNPRYVDAFQEAFQGDAQQKGGIGANEQMILSYLCENRLDVTVANVRAGISALWDSLADNPTYTSQKFVDDQRTHRIAEMTQNGTAGFSIQVGPRKFAFDKHGKTFDYQAGMAQGGSLSLKGAWSPGQGGFDSMDDAAVENLYTLWCTTNDLKNMSKEDLRKLVKDGGRTNLFGRDTHPDVAPTKDERLHHPVTGDAFNQRSLKKYIDEAPYNSRNLISRNGRVVPRLRQLFEMTFNGELG